MVTKYPLILYSWTGYPRNNEKPPKISVFSERSNLFSTDIYLKCQKMRFLVDRNGQKLSPDKLYTTHVCHQGTLLGTLILCTILGITAYLRKTPSIDEKVDFWTYCFQQYLAKNAENMTFLVNFIDWNSQKSSPDSVFFNRVFPD